MDAREAILKMCEISGKSQRAVSSEIGKAPTFLSSTLNKGSTPRVDTMAQVAAACGFVLTLRGHGVEIKLGEG